FSIAPDYLQLGGLRAPPQECVHGPDAALSDCCLWRNRRNRRAHFLEPSPGRWIGMRTPTVVHLPCRPMMLTSPSSIVARSRMPSSPSDLLPESSRPVKPRPLSCTSRISLLPSSFK